MDSLYMYLCHDNYQCMYVCIFIHHIRDYMKGTFILKINKNKIRKNNFKNTS